MCTYVRIKIQLKNKLWPHRVLFWLLSLTTELIFFLVFSSTEHSKSTLSFLILWIPQKKLIISVVLMQWWKTDVLCPLHEFSYLDKSPNRSVSWISNLHLILNLKWYESFCPYCSVLREFESPLGFFTFQITQPTSFHLVPSGPSLFFDDTYIPFWNMFDCKQLQHQSDVSRIETPVPIPKIEIFVDKISTKWYAIVCTSIKILVWW